MKDVPALFALMSVKPYPGIPKAVALRLDEATSSSNCEPRCWCRAHFIFLIASLNNVWLHAPCRFIGCTVEMVSVAGRSHGVTDESNVSGRSIEFQSLFATMSQDSGNVNAHC